MQRLWLVDAREHSGVRQGLRHLLPAETATTASCRPPTTFACSSPTVVAPVGGFRLRVIRLVSCFHAYPPDLPYVQGHAGPEQSPGSGSPCSAPASAGVKPKVETWLYRPPAPYSEFLAEFSDFLCDLVLRTDKVIPSYSRTQCYIQKCVGYFCAQ